MTVQETKNGFGSTARGPGGQGTAAASRIASEIKQRWDLGEPIDAAAAVAAHPELRKYRSVILDLAYTEYRRRLEAGEPLDPGEFAERFPELKKSLYFMLEVERLLSCNFAAQEDAGAIPWPSAGDQFLGFSLISELGRGTFGRVFLAAEPSLGDRLVAVKIAPKGHAEAEMLAKFRHPNIVPVYSIQEEQLSGLTAVCMPYLGHTTLWDVLDHAFADGAPPCFARVILDILQERNESGEAADAMAFDRVLRTGLYVEGIVHFLAQLADALAYAHALGICHRDLKPSNVLLSSHGQPLLLDFNLSSDAKLGLFRVGGTLPYMAPEQLRTVVADDARAEVQADPRSDLFGLGVIGYELLCGSLPFGAIPWDRSVKESAEQLIEQQARGPQPLRERNPQVDKRLAALLEDCLALNPERRPQTAAALAAALRSQLAPLPRLSRRLRRHPRLTSTAAVLVLAWLVALGGWLAAREPYAIRRLSAGVAYSQQGRHDLALKPLGESIQADPKNAAGWLARGRAHLKLGDYRQANEDFNTARRLSPTPQAIAGLAFCLTKLRFHAEAIDSYRQAISMGYERAAVFNDMGYSLRQLNRLADAETSLRKALALDPKLTAAHCNLLGVAANRVLQDRAVPVFAIDAIEPAIAACPPSVEVFRDAAALCAMGAKQDPGLIHLALEYLQKAVTHGLDRGAVKGDARFSSLRARPEFQTLISARPKHVQRSATIEPLVDPL